MEGTSHTPLGGTILAGISGTLRPFLGVHRITPSLMSLGLFFCDLCHEASPSLAVAPGDFPSLTISSFPPCGNLPEPRYRGVMKDTDREAVGDSCESSCESTPHG